MGKNLRKLEISFSYQKVNSHTEDESFFCVTQKDDFACVKLKSSGPESKWERHKKEFKKEMCCIFLKVFLTLIVQFPCFYFNFISWDVC